MKFKPLVECKSLPCYLAEDTARKVDDLVKTLPKDKAFEYRRKNYVSGVEELSEGESVSWISTKDVDREGDVVLPDGIDLTDYVLNPIVLRNHDENQIIGKCLWIKATDFGLKAKTKYASTPLGQECHQLEKEGILVGKSIGFLPLEIREPTRQEKSLPEFKGCEFVIQRSLLLEFSSVAIPACPTALTIEVKQHKPPKPKRLTEAEVLARAVQRLRLDPDRVAAEVLRRLKGGV